MNSKERVLTSLNWQDTDRVPIQYYGTPEVNSMLAEHFGRQDFRANLGVDTRWVPVPYRGALRDPEGDIRYDMWGAGYRPTPNGAGGTYDEAVDLPLARLQTMDDVESYPWPAADAFDYSGVAEGCRRIEEFAVCVGGAGSPDIVNGVSRGRGMEQVLLDIAMRDEVGLAIIDKRVDLEYDVLRRTLEAADGLVDILCLGEDCGTQHGRLVSPADFDEVFRPRLQRFIDLAHEFGARAMMHSCGDTHELMPTFIEMGLDVLDAMQPEPPGMDPETIRAACRGKLAFCGLISTQQTLPYGTVDECRAEARHRIDTIAPGGGYIFAPAHCIQPGSPLENILAVYEEAIGHVLTASDVGCQKSELRREPLRAP
jgi:uroporphyrinogen decarboxylase